MLAFPVAGSYGLNVLFIFQMIHGPTKLFTVWCKCMLYSMVCPREASCHQGDSLCIYFRI